ncbi:S8 family peptidase [Cupriavidus sp. EM10]|uniref:S8 family peptidase n=1 Tax=Cupriavidus sp. EM10 TaxID=2839983 RepID=UPI001C005A94|nr:S8 family peptidase [Cupriavidus sp. EM10]QWE98158.1 S8 family peptidase [Cupriavidus sp. EM10]
MAALQKAKPASGRVAWQDSPADSFVASLVELGRKLGIYVVVERELDIMSHAYVGLVDSPGFAILDGFARLDQVGEQLKVDGDFSLDAHKELLHLLGEHPNVRSVAVPSVLFADRISTLEAAAAGQRIQRRSTVISLTPAKLPPPAKGASYPTVAVVDGGIAAKFRPWIKGTYGDIPEDERDLEHGTNIAGLLVAAQSLNSGYVQRFEEDGCWLIDIAIHPTDEYAGDYYENGSAKFLDALESIVAQCKAEHGVRVFNFSLNNRTDVLPNQFSDEGMRLDAIARRHDVFFVISAGNAKEADARPQWDSRPFSAALQLSEVRTDTLWGPADSLVNVSVGATNGAGVQGCIVDAPARYSRRGPGVRGSIKPDVCHIGGADRDGDPNTGLMSVSKEGMLAAVKGTSMAAPLAAKTLAALDLEMGGHAPREVVQAVYLHNTYFAPPLTGMQAKRTARHLVGFGYPRPSAQTLQLDRHTFGWWCTIACM